MGIFLVFCMYFIQHCIIYLPSDSTLSKDTEIEPRTIATWHWQSDALTTTLDLIHIFYNCVTELQLCIHFRAWALCLIFTKGHEIFCFRFFSCITVPQAPDNNSRIISNFFEISQVKVHHRCQRHRWQICHWYQRHRRQVCHRYQRHRRQILPPVPLMLLTPVANNWNNIRLQTPESEIEGKNLYICFLYYPKVTK